MTSLQGGQQPDAEPMKNPQDVSNQGGQLVDRSIGDLISELRKLDARQVELVLQHQRQHGVRFGEAAIALKLASRDDVLWALSQQFHYPYAVEGGLSGLSNELVAAIEKSVPIGSWDGREVLRRLRAEGFDVTHEATR